MERTGQVLRELKQWKRADGTQGTSVGFDRHYDLHDNLVRSDVRRLGLAGTIDATDPRATTVTRFDVLRRPIATLVELEPVPDSTWHELEHREDWEPWLAARPEREKIAVTKMHYAADGKLARVEHPEATIGRQPGNVETMEHDERGLLFRKTSAPGTPLAVTTQMDYDGLGNVTRTTEGVGLAEQRVTTNVHDGFGRLVKTVDAMGNEHHRSYIDTLVHHEWTIGQQVDVAGNAGAVCLQAKKYSFDALLRVVGTHVAIFDDTPATCDGVLAASADHWASTTTELTLRGPAKWVQDPMGRKTTYSLDSLGRVESTTGPAGDTTTITYDVNSVPVATVVREIAALGQPPVLWETRQRADTLGRVEESTDAGLHSTFTERAEGDRILSVTDARGFTTRFEHDTAGRLIATHRELWIDGTFQREIVTRQAWDHAGRLVTQSDDATNETTHSYDELGRLAQTMMPDGSTYLVASSPLGTLVETRDPNGNLIVTEHDLLGRRIRRDSPTESPGVLTHHEPERFVVDGLGRLKAHGAESGLGRQVALEHDSRGLVTREVADDGSLGSFGSVHVHDAAGALEATCYEASGKQLRHVRDDAGRLHQILMKDWSPAQTCGAPDAAETLVIQDEYTGPRRQRRTYGNGIVLDIVRDADLHRAEDVVWRLESGLAEEIYRRAYQRNEVHDRVFLGKSELHDHDLIETHDSLHRLVTSEHVGGETFEFALDGVGNREGVTEDGVAIPYEMGSSVPLNQYEFADGLYLGYDDNGNVVARVPVAGDTRPAIRFAFDALNRPDVAWVGPWPSFQTTSLFSYDALNRRVGKAVDGVSPPSSARYFHIGEALVEERDVATGAIILRVYGGWALDDLVLQVRGAERTWITTDSQSSVIKAFDDGGELVEQFSYSDFGEPSRATSIDGTFSSGAVSSRGITQLFTGAWHDRELGLYWLRTRFMDPELGRFLSRDPAGIWADGAAMGNGYTYAANNPGTMVDPLGLYALPGFEPPSDGIGDGKFGGWDLNQPCFLCGSEQSDDESAGESAEVSDSDTSSISESSSEPVVAGILAEAQASGLETGDLLVALAVLSSHGLLRYDGSLGKAAEEVRGRAIAQAVGPTHASTGGPAVLPDRSKVGLPRFRGQGE